MVRLRRFAFAKAMIQMANRREVKCDYCDRTFVYIYLRDCGPLVASKGNSMNSENQNGSDSFYHQLVYEMPLGFAHCEMIFEKWKPIDFVYLAVNKAFYQLTGFGNVIGKRISEIIPDLPSTNAEMLECYGRVALTGQSENFETEIPAINMWLNISVQSPLRGHFIAIFENITKRKNAEQLIHGSQAELRAILDTIPDYVLNISPDLNIRYINKIYPGVTIEQVKGSSI